jgi:hypothetical protein
MEEPNLEKMPEWQKYIAIACDEMKIKENVECNKHTTEGIGFVDLGDFNEELADLECQ